MLSATVILVDCYDRTRLDHDDGDGSHRLAHSLSSSGLSITLTSLCSAMAFFVGSAVDMPGVTAFCIYAAWSFVANYILQFLVFVPLMVMDDRRIRNKKNFCCPCLCEHSDTTKVSQVAELVSVHSSVTNANQTGDAGTSAATRETMDSTTSMDHSQELQSVPDTAVSQPKDSWLAILLLPLMTRRITRWLIIFLFLCTLSVSLYFIPSIETGSEPETYVPDDSVILEVVETQDTLWSGAKIIEQDIVIKNQDFSDIAVRDNVHRLISDLESQDDALNAVENWLDEFESFLNETGQDIDSLDSTIFYSELQSFCNGTRWESEIIYDDALNPTKIEMTRFALSANGANRFGEVWPDYEAWNDVFDEHLPSESDGFVLYLDALMGYLNAVLLSLTMTNMIFAGIGVSAVLMVFVDLRMALFMTVIIAMIDVHLMAWLRAFGILLDGTVYLICVIAVGLTVDYLIHITHSIADAQPEGDSSSLNSDEIFNCKLKIAMNSMGVSVWFVCCV